MLKELNDMDIVDPCKIAVINNKFLRQNGDIAALQDWQTLSSLRKKTTPSTGREGSPTSLARESML